MDGIWNPIHISCTSMKEGQRWRSQYEQSSCRNNLSRCQRQTKYHMYQLSPLQGTSEMARVSWKDCEWLSGAKSSLQKCMHFLMTLDRPSECARFRMLLRCSTFIHNDNKIPGDPHCTSTSRYSTLHLIAPSSVQGEVVNQLCKRGNYIVLVFSN